MQLQVLVDRRGVFLSGLWAQLRIGNLRELCGHSEEDRRHDPAIRDALKSAADENVAEDSIRHICENGLVKLVSSFQTYAEASFHRLPNSAQFTVRRNLFQNLEESDAIWRDAAGRGYTDILYDDEYGVMNKYFQQRHLLSHQEGIVDQQYVQRSGDSELDVGQRLRVAAENVLERASVIDKLIRGLASIP